MRKLRPILLASFFFAFHLAFITYLNSTVLGQYLTPKGVGIMFTIAAACSLLLVPEAARLVAKLGAVKYMTSVLGVSALLLVLLGITSAHAIFALVFIFYFALNPLILYGFDLFLEHFSHPNTTGNVRGTYLGLGDIAWVIAPAFAGIIQHHYGYGIVYIFAACAVACAIATLFIGERDYQDPQYVRLTLKRMVKVLGTPEGKDVRGSIIVSGLLQLFYVWMVIYSPLYLIRTLGYNWEQVAFAFSFMLIAFLLIEYPLGKIADRFSNERELIAAGLLIMGVSTMAFALINGVSIAAIALILFLTRVGASVVEISNESYFFKQVRDTDSLTIAVFRNMAPLAYFLGPVLAAILLGWSAYGVLFFILGVIIIIGAIYALTFDDTKPQPEPLLIEVDQTK